jgi:predicted choloylglycine hydrolase
MKKKSSTINKNKIEKTKRKIKIKISHIVTQVIYMVMFNKFLNQNKFIIEKQIKFVIETDTHIKFIEQ